MSAGEEPEDALLASLSRCSFFAVAKSAKLRMLFIVLIRVEFSMCA